MCGQHCATRQMFWHQESWRQCESRLQFWVCHGPDCLLACWVKSLHNENHIFGSNKVTLGLCTFVGTVPSVLIVCNLFHRWHYSQCMFKSSVHGSWRLWEDSCSGKWWSFCIRISSSGLWIDSLTKCCFHTDRTPVAAFTSPLYAGCANKTS